MPHCVPPARWAVQNNSSSRMRLAMTETMAMKVPENSLVLRFAAALST
jgi:hypothetical protein